jgi:hypothetical protein
VTIRQFCVKLTTQAQNARLSGKAGIPYEDIIYQQPAASAGALRREAPSGASNEMNDVMLSSLKSYWEKLRAGRIAPYRAEIDPRQFDSALENMFIIEKLSADNMRIRLSGMKICEMMGMEVRGMQPGYLIDEPDRQRFERLLNVVMAEPAVIELKLEAPTREGSYHATMLLMPLRSDFGEINRVLGCTSGEGDVLEPPLAFTIQDVSVTPIEPNQSADANTLMPGFAEEKTGFAAAPAAPKLVSIEGNPDAPGTPREGGPKLRIVDSK